MFPKQLGYRMPAEWETHQRTFIAWPVRESMCYPEDEETVCRGYAELCRAVAEFEPVTVVVNPDDRRRAEELTGMPPHVDFLAIPHNDSWIRDSGPTFLRGKDGGLAAVNWKFNAWGGKYAPWDLDDQLAPSLLDHCGIRRFDAPLVMEGGSFHTDGEGTLITTEQCLLHPNRNPGMSKAQIEEYLRQYLGIEKVIWLKRGLFGDETDGHVDNLACFAAPGKVLLQVCDDPGDENYDISRENAEILASAEDARGRKLEVVPIPQPPAAYHEGARLTLSYINFYFVNRGIILPIFGGEAEDTDRRAMEVLRREFPDRRIRTVDGMAIIREGGNVHCATQQMPAALS
jgi:agmatine deiminase